jgi:hypothetical protein
MFFTSIDFASLYSAFRIKFLACFCLLLLLPLGARGEGPQLSGRAGFGGMGKEDKWIPISLLLTNQGDTFSGTAAVEVENSNGNSRTTYSHPVLLGAKARQQVTLYIRGNSLPGRIPIYLQPRRGRKIFAEVPLTSLTSEDRLIVVIAPERGALAFLSGTARKLPPSPSYRGGSSPGTINVADASPNNLPDSPAAYESIDLLVLGDVSPQEIPPEARTAIRDWVLGGGTLVVMGGPDWARLKDPFFDALLPVTVSGSAALSSLAGLSSPFGPAPAEAAIVTRATPLAGADILAAQGDVPLLVDGPAGSGRVIFLAFDALRPPLRGWAGQTPLWDDLLSRAENATPLLNRVCAENSIYYGPALSTGESKLAGAVLNIPALKTPPFWLIAVFLAGYLLLLVPVNYFVLKHRNRRELAWLTTPLIVLIFTFSAYLLGYGLRGGQLIVNQLEVLETNARVNAAKVITYSGIFSPSRTNYAISPNDATGAISEVDLSPDSTTRKSLTVVQTDRMILPQVTMDMWSMRIFRTEKVTSLGKGLTTDLALKNNRAVGKITNHTGMDLNECEIHVGNVSENIGKLANNASLSFSVDLSGAEPPRLTSDVMPYYRGGPGSPNTGSGGLKGQVNDLFFGAMTDSNRGILLTGWRSRPFNTLSLNGQATRPKNASFLIFHLPLSYAGAGTITLPFGSLEAAIIDEQGSQQQPEGIDLSDGYLVQEFRLPGNVGDFSPTKMELVADIDSSRGGGHKLALQLYNWQDSRWETISRNAGQCTVADPERFIARPGGIIRAKFVCHVSGGSPVSLRTFDVSLLGQGR